MPVLGKPLEGFTNMQSTIRWSLQALLFNDSKLVIIFMYYAIIFVIIMIFIIKAFFLSKWGNYEGLKDMNFTKFFWTACQSDQILLIFVAGNSTNSTSLFWLRVAILFHSKALSSIVTTDLRKSNYSSVIITTETKSDLVLLFQHLVSILSSRKQEQTCLWVVIDSDWMIGWCITVHFLLLTSQTCLCRNKLSCLIEGWHISEDEGIMLNKCAGNENKKEGCISGWVFWRKSI